MKIKQMTERLNSVPIRKKAKQILAVTLAVLMVNPVTGYGVSAHAQEAETITAFGNLSSEIAAQRLPVGAEESDINLPDTLDVTISVNSADTAESIVKDSQPVEIPTEEVKPDENTPEEPAADESPVEDSSVSGNDVEEPQEDENAAEDNTATDSEATVIVDSGEVPLAASTTGSAISADLDDADTEPAETVQITSEERTLTGITWQINAERSGSDTFNSESAGAVFYYEPVLPEGYVLADGVSLPQITVEVAQAVMLMTATVGDTITIGSVEYANKGDASTTGITTKPWETNYNPLIENCYWTAGEGYVLYKPTVESGVVKSAEVTFHDATISTEGENDAIILPFYYGIPVDVTVYVEGTNSLTSSISGGHSLFHDGDGTTFFTGGGTLLLKNSTEEAQFNVTCRGFVIIENGTQLTLEGGSENIIEQDLTVTDNGSKLTLTEGTEINVGNVRNDSTITLTDGGVLENNGMLNVIGYSINKDSTPISGEISGSGGIRLKNASTTYIRVDGTFYVDGGDISSSGLDLTTSKPTDVAYYTAGSGSALFTPKNGDIPDSLTLDNATISGGNSPLRLGTETVIKLEGANTLTNTTSDSGVGIFASSDGTDMPIIIKGDSGASLTVNAYQCTRLGELTISGAKVDMNGSCYGITTTGDLLINDGAQVTAKEGEFGTALQVGIPPMGNGGIMPPSPSPSLTVKGGSTLTVNGSAMINGGFCVGSGSTITIPEGNNFIVLAMNSGSITNNGTIVNNGIVLLPFTLSAAEVNALGISGEVILIDPTTPGKEYIYLNDTLYLYQELGSKLDLQMGLPEEATYYKLESGDHDCYILFTPANGSESPVITLHDVDNTGYLQSGIKLPSNSITFHLEGVNLIDSITGDGNIAITGNGRLDTEIIRVNDTATLTIADEATADVLHRTGALSGTSTYTLYGNRSDSLEIYQNDRLILAPGAVLTLEATYGQKLYFDEGTTLANHLGIGKGAKIVNNSMVILPQGTTAEQIKALSLSGTGLVMVPTAYGDEGEPTAAETYRNDGTTIKPIDRLDVTTGDHTGKTVENDGYAWNDSTNTLTLGNTALGGEIKLPATVTIHTTAHSTIVGDLEPPTGETLNLTLSGTAPLDIMGKISGNADGDTVTVQGGAKVTTGRISIGSSGGANGTLNVKGAGTSLTVSEQYSSAVYCQTINVTDSATLTASSEHGVGVMAMGGNVTVTGGSTLTTNCEYGVYIIDGKLTVDNDSKLITNGTVAPFCVVDKTSSKVQGDVLTLPGVPEGTEIASVTGTSANYWSLVPTNGSLSVSNENSEPVALFGAKTGALTFVKASGGDNSGGNNNNGSAGSSGGSSSYDYFAIKLSKESNGTISPDGGHDNTLSVRKWTDQTFTFTPDKGYQVSDVLVDGKSIGAKSSYTFEDVTKDHTLKVIFKKSGGHENPQTGVDFEDVTEKDWFYDSVVSAVGKGWFAGTSDTTFSPCLSTTRGMIATVLWRMEQTPNFSSATIFEDVLQGQWYYDGVTWAQENGIVKGYGNGKFGPNDNITREQFASILYRYAQFKGFDVSQTASLDGFSDGNKVSAYATETMKWAVGANLTSGKGNGILDPSGKATRAEVATILTRFHTLVGSK